MPEPNLIPFHPFNLGIDRKSPPTLMPLGYVSRAENVWFDRGVIKQRKGYAIRRKLSKESTDKFPISDVWAVGHGTYSVDDYVRNTVTGVIRFFRCKVEHSSAANYEPGVGADWEDKWTEFYRPILALCNFYTPSGDEIEFVFDSHHVWKYNYSDGTLDSAFTDGVRCFDGETSLGQLSITEAPDSNGSPVIVFTDGFEYDSEHTIYFYDGETEKTLANSRLDMTGANSWTDFLYAKQVIWYADHFIIGDYAADTLRRRNGLAWGDLLELGIADFDAGDAAERLLTDAKGTMKRFIRLGAHLLIYFSGSIAVCDPVTSDDIYEIDVRVQGIGLVSASAVIDIGGVHIFAGEDDFYVYDGGLEPRAIGDRIFNLFYNALNVDAKERIVTQHIPSRTLAVFYYPSGDDDYARNYIAYDYRLRTFTYGVVANFITAASSTGIQTVAWCCDDEPFASTPCDGAYATWPCSAFTFKAGFSVPLLGDFYGRVFDYSDIDLTDNGSAILANFVTDSKPMGTPYGAVGVVSEIRLESRGSKFVLSYTNDTDPDTEEWKPLGNFGGTLKFTSVIVPVHIVCAFIAFKVTFDKENSSTEVRIISVRAKHSAVRSLS